MSTQSVHTPARVYSEWLENWNRFWFTPSDPIVLGLIRAFSGAMLFYSLLIWGKDLLGFFGPTGRLPGEFASSFYSEAGMNWSHLYWLEGSPLGLWIAHLLAMLFALLYCFGIQTRITGFAAFLIAVSYANRATGALFGLDQIVAMLTMYTMLGPSGSAFSLEQWWRNRKSDHASSDRSPPSFVGATVSVRLIQLHMCVIYLFAGLGKLQGETWWNGEAIWGAVANAEYQTLDLTWMAAFPLLINAATLITVAWEVSYSALIWPRLTRPIVVALAIPLHLGIACAMGMITFGLIMLVGNLAFVSPAVCRKLLSVTRLARATNATMPITAQKR